MSRLDELIAQVRAERTWYSSRRYYVEAAACAIREKALLDAREAVLGKVESGYKFNPRRSM